MSDIFVEVDEALKREKLEKLWQKYGGFFIGFLAVIILGTAANSGYRSWEISQNTKQTNILLSVIDKKDYNANDLLEISKQLKKGGVYDIAKVQAAGLLAQNGNTDQAVKIYNEIANDKKSDKKIKQLASYMAIDLSKDKNAEEKLIELNKISSDIKNPWHNHALLDSALIQANVNNNYTKARENLALILKTQNVAQTLKQKAQSLDILYALKEKTQNTNK